jgi:hypothetical protein
VPIFYGLRTHQKKGKQKKQNSPANSIHTNAD